MVDTKRTLTAIYALLADNTTGLISPQDIRDTVATLAPGHGELSITASAATTISTADTFTAVAGTYALSGNAMNWDMNTNGQLRYTGTPDRVVHIANSLSFTTAGNNKVMEIAVAKNGTPIASSTVSRKTGTSGDVGSTAVHAFTSVSTNDYLTVMISNTTDTVDSTVTYLNLFAMDMPIAS